MAKKPTKAKRYSPSLELTDDHFKAIGKVAVNWSRLEFLLGRAIAELLGTDLKPGRIITTRLSAENLIEIFKQLAEYRDPNGKFTNDLNKLYKCLDKARQKRRLIIHGIWAADEEGNPKVLQYYGKADNRILAKTHNMSVQDIKAIHDDVWVAVKAFQLWWDSVRDALIPSNNKP